jgi:hypothetical protein
MYYDTDDGVVEVSVLWVGVEDDMCLAINDRQLEWALFDPIFVNRV